MGASSRSKQLADFKYHIYSPDNKHYPHPLPAADSLPLSLAPLPNRPDAIRCGLCLEGDQLLCRVQLDDHILYTLDRHLVEIRIFNNRPQSPTALVAVDIFSQNNQPYYYINHGFRNKLGSLRNIKQGKMRADCRPVSANMQQGDMLRFLLDLKDYDFFLCGKVILAADISYYEKLSEDNYYLLASNFTGRYSVPLLMVE